MKSNPSSMLGGDLSRRAFIGAMATTAASAALLRQSVPKDQSIAWYRDSFGNVVPASPEMIELGLLPPPAGPPIQAKANSEIANGNRTVDAFQNGQGAAATAEVPTHRNPDFIQPNILIVMVDQLRRPRWLPPGGQAAIDAILPNIAKIRSHSLNFPNYFVAAAACSPSRATFLTGLYTQQTCLFRTQAGKRLACTPSLNTGFPTIASVLAQPVAGYNSYWIRKWRLSDGVPGGVTPGENGPVDYGFDPTIPRINLPPNNAVASPCGLGNGGVMGDNPNGFRVPQGLGPSVPNIADPSFDVYDDAAIADFFLNTWLPNVPSGKPWCTTVSFVNPHDITSFPYSYGITSPGTLFEAPDAPAPGSPRPCGPDDPPRGCVNLFTSFPAPPTAGYDAPAGSSARQHDDQHVPAKTQLYTAAPSSWNVLDNPAGPANAKPRLQEYGQTMVNAHYGYVRGYNLASPASSKVSGWVTFLNYYFWMQSCVDFHIGRVVNKLRALPSWKDTILIFTSDHGDYGGSHWMKAKGGALYDEVLNVPLYISFNALRQDRNGNDVWDTIADNPALTKNFTCSSVDILPFIYSLALGNESWRAYSNDMVYYLRNRESILDFIHAQNPIQRRIAYSQGDPGATLMKADGSGPQPYILHTTDEFIADPRLTCPGNAIAFRTVDTSVIADSALRLYGGGKLGMYSYWPVAPIQQPRDTQPDLTRERDFEFYNYTAGNAGETGNSYESDPLALRFQSSFESIKFDELYDHSFTGNPAAAAAYAQALAAYATMVSCGLTALDVEAMQS